MNSWFAVYILFLKAWTLKNRFPGQPSPIEQIRMIRLLKIQLQLAYSEILQTLNSRFLNLSHRRYCRFDHSFGFFFMAWPYHEMFCGNLYTVFNTLFSHWLLCTCDLSKSMMWLSTWQLPLMLPKLLRRAGDYSLYYLFFQSNPYQQRALWSCTWMSCFRNELLVTWGCIFDSIPRS